MTNQNNAAQAANDNPLSDEYVNAIIQRHGYDSPESVIAQLHQWIGLHGGEDTVTLLMYEAHKALSKLRAPVADERQAVAYLDLGTGGYMDVGTDLTDEQLAALPKGRHMLAIVGTHGVNGYNPASAPVAGEAVTDEMIQAGAKAAREYFERTGGNDPAVIYSAMRAAAPAAPQASAENDWKPAIRKFMDTAIPALAAIANVHTPDEIDALEAMPREPVIDQVRRLSQACEELSRQVRPERPKADKDAPRCTCPSGDGSLRHPCPAHPQTNKGRA